MLLFAHIPAGARWPQERHDAGRGGTGCGLSTPRSGEGCLVLDALPTGPMTLGKSHAFLSQVAGMAPRISHLSVHIFLIWPWRESSPLPCPKSVCRRWSPSAGGAKGHRHGVARERGIVNALNSCDFSLNPTLALLLQAPLLPTVMVIIGRNNFPAYDMDTTMVVSMLAVTYLLICLCVWTSASIRLQSTRHTGFTVRCLGAHTYLQNLFPCSM